MLYGNYKDAIFYIIPYLREYAFSKQVYALVKKKTLNLFSLFITILVVKRKKPWLFFIKLRLKLSKISICNFFSAVSHFLRNFCF